MTDLLTALALDALFPQPLKRAAVMLVRQPESRLRVTGLVLACLGVAAVWAIRHHS
jgi:uncharacterized protein YjeT (DUF2065 family)